MCAPPPLSSSAWPALTPPLPLILLETGLSSKAPLKAGLSSRLPRSLSPLRHWQDASAYPSLWLLALALGSGGPAWSSSGGKPGLLSRPPLSVSREGPEDWSSHCYLLPSVFSKVITAAFK